MDRNVYAEPVRLADGTTGPPAQPKPAEKLVKYFPAEAFALYAALEPACASVFAGRTLSAALWVSLVISVVLCVMVLKRFWKVRRSDQIAISCVALVVYVAALGGPFATLGWWKAGFALIASILVSAFIIFTKAPTRPDDAD